MDRDNMGKKLPVNRELQVTADLVAAIGEFGGRVRTHRNQLRMTQAELAESAGVTINTVTGWELGGKLPENPATLVRLAFTLNVSVDYLLTGRPLWSADSVFKEVWALADRLQAMYLRMHVTRDDTSDPDAKVVPVEAVASSVRADAEQVSVPAPTTKRKRPAASGAARPITHRRDAR